MTARTPKGKNVSGDDMNSIAGKFLFGGGLSLLFSGEKPPTRDDVMRDETDDYVVDTVVGYDTGVWETGIASPHYNEGEWVIVSQYSDRAQAEKGHVKWVRAMEGKPRKLTDVFLSETFKRDAD